jgi:hypothetical protein
VLVIAQCWPKDSAWGSSGILSGNDDDRREVVGFTAATATSVAWAIRFGPDRLNDAQTALWVALKPLTGWGIGRFAAVNTYHHQQWSPAIPWMRVSPIPHTKTSWESWPNWA